MPDGGAQALAALRARIDAFDGAVLRHSGERLAIMEEVIVGRRREGISAAAPGRVGEGRA